MEVYEFDKARLVTSRTEDYVSLPRVLGSILIPLARPLPGWVFAEFEDWMAPSLVDKVAQ